jgi:drug/metabolite transporter (DMT)-like permease
MRSPSSSRASGVSIWQIAFCRALFAFIPTLALLQMRRGWRDLRTRRLRDHLLRSAITITALACFFYGVGAMPLADAYALTFAAPLFMTALSMPLLRERVGRHRWAAVCVGFVGVLIMVRPGGGVFDPAALVLLAGTLLYAVGIILVRGLSATEPTLTIVFYFNLFGSLIAGAALPISFAPPEDWLTAGLMVAIGCVGGLAQLLLTHAYARAPVAVIAPFDYTAMIWAVLIGLVVFGDVPQPTMLLGAALVIGSGIYILHREARRRPTAPISVHGGPTA